jgi:hypothetical protein
MSKDEQVPCQEQYDQATHERRINAQLHAENNYLRDLRKTMSAEVERLERTVEELKIESGNLHAEVQRLTTLCASVGAAHDKVVTEFRAAEARAALDAKGTQP